MQLINCSDIAIFLAAIAPVKVPGLITMSFEDKAF
jgi:hypothetical protein